MNKIDGNFLRGHLETMILSVLERADAHGFEILRRLEKDGCGALEMKEGSLYPAIYRMESAGLVGGRWEETEERRRGPRRRIYALTPKGRRELAKRREHWKDFVGVLGRIIEAEV
jgi:DNA-binding PadR family transcriptional regulator